MSRDTWDGNENQPMSYNMWQYGYANPVNKTDPTGNKPGDPAICTQNGPQYCILNNGAFIDKSHFSPKTAGEFWKDLKQAKGKGETTLPPIQQYAPGLIFSGRYIVNIPETTSLEELKGVGVSIWWDFEVRFEKWQYKRYPLGEISSFETADIPSTYLGYISAVKGYSYETIVTMLGGGHPSDEPPTGHSHLANWIGNYLHPCDLKECLSGYCPRESARNDSILLKAQTANGYYKMLTYPPELYIAPVNKYWKFKDWWDDPLIPHL
jgi:hypothetical protein